MLAKIEMDIRKDREIRVANQARRGLIREEKDLRTQLITKQPNLVKKSIGLKEKLALLSD